MMRLVFLFCAEERELLLLGDDLYDKNYAVSHAAGATAGHGGPVRRRSPRTPSRCLAPAADHVPGRLRRRQARPAQAPGLRRQPVRPRPLPVPRRPQARDDLEGHRGHAAAGQQPHGAAPARSAPSAASQGAGRRRCEARRLSFRALDIEQIGHVYEGLLDHTAKRATEPVLGLAGTQGQGAGNRPGRTGEDLQAKGEKELLKFLKDETGRSESALKKALKAELDDQHVSRFRTACQDDETLWKRVQAVRRPGAARHVRLPGRHHQGQRLRHRRDRPAHAAARTTRPRA